MSFDLAGAEASILLPALAAGLLVTATHVPLGLQVLRKGILRVPADKKEQVAVIARAACQRIG